MIKELKEFIIDSSLIFVYEKKRGKKSSITYLTSSIRWDVCWMLNPFVMLFIWEDQDWCTFIDNRQSRRHDLKAFFSFCFVSLKLSSIHIGESKSKYSLHVFIFLLLCFFYYSTEKASNNANAKNRNIYTRYTSTERKVNDNYYYGRFLDALTYESSFILRRNGFSYFLDYLYHSLYMQQKTNEKQTVERYKRYI